LGLENLKSIFQTDIKNKVEDYKTSQPLPGGAPSSVLASTKGAHSTADNLVILDTLLRQPPAFVSEDLSTKFYNEQQFDSRVPKNNRITINNINTYAGTQYKATPPTDLATLGSDLATQDWSNLYNASHTPKDNPKWNGSVPISYPGVNRDKLRIRNDDAKSGIFNFGRTELLGAGAGEPYIVSHLPTDNFLSGGRVTNAGSRSIPIISAVTDTLRITKYLSSAAGVAFIAKQNALGLVGSKVETPLLSLRGEQASTLVSPQRFNSLYNPLSTLGSSLARLLGTTPNVLLRRDELLPGIVGATSYDQTVFKLDNTFTNNNGPGIGPPIADLSTGFPIAGGSKFKNPVGPKSGDKMTLASMKIGDSLAAAGPDTWAVGKEEENDFVTNLGVNVESHKEGMPLYFKDLRDNKYIFFRAYIEGLTESISPTWASINYIGRSEPVYVYERSERDITFTLRLVAQTSDELKMIYKKMNKLTSLCYPEYMADVDLGGKIKMKPPLTKFRMGEIFGKENNELMGFIKSLNYSVEQSSTWETESGKRVPRHVTANITYQVIHASVPQLDTKFYGYIGD
jgi:hypothetical protein